MYLVAGLGVTGQSVLRYCIAQGEVCLAFDTREHLDVEELQQQFPTVEFALGQVPCDWLGRFESIVLSPGIAKSEPWVVALMAQGKQVIGDIELFARTVGKPVIGITGSNGKSTVTTLTGQVLSEAGYAVAVGGNIGLPVLDLLINDIDYDVYVLELSSFQLETTYSLECTASVVLNISEDHMDRYDELEDYIQAKTKVFANTEVAIIPEDFSTTGMIHHANICRFGLSDGFEATEQDFTVIQYQGEAWFVQGATPIMPVSIMKLQGRHHQLNALAVMALCQSFKVSRENYEAVFSIFSGLPHRTQLVGCYNQVEWVNDSKGTNVGATITALESIGEKVNGKVILLAGGVGKDADFTGLKRPVETFCRHTVLFGRDQKQIGDSLQGLSVSYVDDIEQAIAKAKTLAKAGDCVLFSPACASFDQFANYVQRGEIFTELVQTANQLTGEEGQAC